MKTKQCILAFLLVAFTFIVCGEALMAQRDFHKPEKSAGMQLLISGKADSTTLIYPGNWLNIDSVIIYTVIDNGGYVAGTNVYDDLAKAQRFTADQPGHIVGARYWIGVRDGEEGSLAFNIWSFNGSPGEVLASKVIPANEVTESLVFSQAFYVEFDEPVPVDGDFVVGVDMSDIGDTQIALVSSWDGQAAGLGHSWEKWSDGAWHTFLDPAGWNLDIDLAIFPVIAYPDTVPDIPALQVTAVVNRHVACFGGSDGQATATATGGVEPYTWLWSKGQTSQTASSLSADIYQVTVTDSEGRTATTNANITQPDQLTVTATGTNISIHGGSDGTATASVSGGTAPYTWLWNDSAAQTTQTASNLVAGNYQVTITDANGCLANTGITLTQPDPAGPELAVTVVVNNHVSCFGGSDGQATATATGGVEPYTWLWSDGQTSSTASGLAVGTYQVTVTDSEGGTANANATITQPEQLTVTATGTNISIHGGSDGTATASVSGGTTPYAWLWNDSAAQTTQTASDLVAGTYQVTVTDANGCLANTGITLTQPDPAGPEPVDVIFSNIAVAQRPDGSGIVDLSFDMEGSLRQYFVELEFSADNGQTYAPVAPEHIHGEQVLMAPGVGYQLEIHAREALPGVSTDQAKVRLTAKPGLILKTNVVSQTGRTTATVSGEVVYDGGLSISETGFVYATAENPTLEDFHLAVESDSTYFEHTIDTLQAATTYYMRAYATHARGTAYGEQLVFSTWTPGSIIVHGPAGSTYVLPENVQSYRTTVSVTEHPATDVLMEDEVAASVAGRIHIGNEDAVGDTTSYEINIPVTIDVENPRELRLNVRLTDGVILPVPGIYDSDTKVFTVKTLGLAHDWVVAVVRGAEIVSVSSTDKYGETTSTAAAGAQPWPTLDFNIFETSPMPRRLTEEMISTHILPVARDALIHLHSNGYKAPNLQMDDGKRYNLILDERGSSHYQGPEQGLLGKVYIAYKSQIDDYNDPSTWRFGGVIIHEVFHGIQQSYAYKEVWTYAPIFGKNYYSTSPYDEGSACIIQATYDARGTISPGTISVREEFPSDRPHDVGSPIDDFQNSNPYNKQDFFAFTLNRYFGGDLGKLHEMYAAIGVSAPSTLTTTNVKVLQRRYRKGLDQFLKNHGLSLPEVYTEYVMQRLYIHEEKYLLRSSERNIAVNPEFAPNRFASSLMGDYHYTWRSKTDNLIDYEELNYTKILPVSSRALTMVLPPNLPSQQRPDSLAFTIGVTGGEIISAEKEEGVRIAVLRMNGNTPAAKNPVVMLDQSKPFKVSLDDGVTHLVFIFMNTYVENKPVDIQIRPGEEAVQNVNKKTWYVKIQDAINAADHGDKILVYKGRFKEYLDFKGKNIELKSVHGAQHTIIDGSHWNAYAVVTFESGEGPGAILDGFTLTYSSTRPSRGVDISNNSSPTIRFNLIERFPVGISIDGGSPHIFQNNIGHNINQGLTAKNSTSKIEGNFIRNNTGSGIRITDDSSTIVSNKIDGNFGGNSAGGISVSGDFYFEVLIDKNTITNNTSDYVGSAIHCMGAGKVRITNNTITNNTATGGGFLQGNAISILDLPEVYIYKNIVKNNNSRGMGVGSDAFTIIHNTVDENTEGGISAGGEGIISHNKVRRNSGTLTGAGLNVHGDVMVTENEIISNYTGDPLSEKRTGRGGGIYVSGAEAPFPVIDKNLLKGNESGYGGGIYLDGAATVTGNTMIGNYAEEEGGGLLVNTSSAPVVSGNAFTDNLALKGGGVFIQQGVPMDWDSSEVIEVDANTFITVKRHFPPFDEPHNTYSGNSNLKNYGAWAPGSPTGKIWVENAAYHVMFNE